MTSSSFANIAKQHATPATAAKPRKATRKKPSKDFFDGYPCPDWLPDWMNDQYEDHGDDILSWAWEFLRRNPEYQASYARWAALPDDDGEGSKSPKYEMTFGEWDRMNFFYADPPALSDNETVGEYVKRTSCRPVLLHVHLCNKWKILTLEDPAMELAPRPGLELEMPPYFLQFTEPSLDCGPRNKQRFLEPYNRMLTGRLLAATWPQDDDGTMEVFAIDRRFNVDAQLKLVKEALVEAKKRDVDKERRSDGHVGSFTKLLRLLDATRVGANPDDITKELYEGKANPTKTQNEALDEMERYQQAGKDWLADNLTKAVNLVASGYLDLLRYSQLPKDPRKQSNKPQRAESQK